MAEITVQDVPADGLADFTLAAANAGGDTVVAGHHIGGHELDGVMVQVTNDDTTSKDVTVGSLPALTVAAGDTALIPANVGVGDVTLNVTYSAVTSVTIGAFRL